jgi:hypothetical protein
MLSAPQLFEAEPIANMLTSDLARLKNIVRSHIIDLQSHCAID